MNCAGNSEFDASSVESIDLMEDFGAGRRSRKFDAPQRKVTAAERIDRSRVPRGYLTDPIVLSEDEMRRQRQLRRKLKLPPWSEDRRRAQEMARAYLIKPAIPFDFARSHKRAEGLALAKLPHGYVTKLRATPVAGDINGSDSTSDANLAGG